MNTQLGDNEAEEELFIGIMHTLDLVRYQPLWQGMGVNNLRTLATFIDRPYPMFRRIVKEVQIHTSRFPYVAHTVFDSRGTVVATINETEGVAKIFTGLKLFAKCTVDSYACDLVSAARTVDTHNIISLYTGFRNLYFRTSYNHILKYLTDRILRLAEGDTRSAYTSTLSQVHSNDLLSVWMFDERKR
jgi:hypothetical protein